MSMFDPRLWLAIVLAVGAATGLGYRKGVKDERDEILLEQAKAAAEARETEGELQRVGNRATSAYLDRMLKQQEKARALPPITLVNDCPVPGAAIGVLNDAQRMPGDAGTGSSAGAAGTQADSSCAAELDIAKRNYAEICIPNAEQLTAIQERWETTRTLVNRGRKGEVPP
jgi:hypothetical protein